MSLTKATSPMLDLRYDSNQDITNTSAGVDALLNTPAPPVSGPDSQTNTAFGYEALKTNDDGYGNTAVGYQALSTANTLASNAQTAIGANALSLSTTGGGNTALGFDACHKNTTGGSNVGIGKGALYSNDAGSYNVAIGLDAIGTGAYPVAGNAGDRNVGIGFNAMTSVQNSNDNVAIGTESADNMASLTSCVAIGSYAMKGAVGSTSTNAATNSIAIGYGSMYGVASAANNNIAIGAYAGYFLNTGDQNVALGTSALYGVSGSGGNGYQNTSIGDQSMYMVTTGNSNVAVGARALYSVESGTGHVAVGLDSLYSATNTSIDNTGLGNSAGKFITSGQNNTCIGRFSGTNVSPFYVTTQNNRVVVGDSYVTNAYIQVAWTVVSDARDKIQVQPLTHGLDFVAQLNPVSFKFRIDRDSEETNGNKHYGFLAQEVLAIEGDDNVIVDNEDPDKLKMTNEELIPVLVKAIQELKSQFEEYKANHP